MREWLERRPRGFWRWVVRQGLIYATIGAVGGVVGQLALRPDLLERRWGLIDLLLVAALGFVLVAATIGPALWHWCQFTANRRRRQGLCPRCCYDVRASLEHGSTRCPECGLALD